MKIILVVLALFLVGLAVFGCRIHSWIVLDNPEFPHELRPADVKGTLLDKYSVGDVIVKPRISPADGNQTNYQADVVFFCEATNRSVSVESVAVSINGVDVSYGDGLINKSPYDWTLFKANKPFYACSISGEPIARPKGEMTKARIDISLVVAVTDETGEVVRKQIDAYFVPKKRSYLE